MTDSTNRDSSALPQFGALYATLAYGAWGLLPIYWKFFGSVPALEVLSHRILWSVVFFMGLLWLQRRQAELNQVRRSPQAGKVLLLTAFLLSFNWGIYIYGVNTDRVVETSLGYFITPLLNVLLGVAFLRERLNLGQCLAVLLAVLGVGSFVWRLGNVPWIALALALSFASYGLLRKVIAVSPMVGLAIETLFVAPIALVLVGYGSVSGSGHWQDSWTLKFLFAGSGIITALPLLWFNNAAKRLRLSTLGFFQYIAPTIQLILGVFLYREPFTTNHAITFGFIWSAIAVYSVTSWLQSRQKTA